MASVKRKRAKNNAGVGRRPRREEPEYSYDDQLPEKEPIWVCVQGYKVSSELAVTPCYSDKGWSITHMPTGAHINADHVFRSAGLARKASLEILKLGIPWDRLRAADPDYNRAQIPNYESTMQKLRQIMSKYGKAV